MSWKDRLSAGLSRTRTKISESFNVLLDRGPEVDEQFWEGLEENLIVGDMGAPAALDIVATMRKRATREAMPDAYAVIDAMAETIAGEFCCPKVDPFEDLPSTVLFVGVNGAGKTTTVGKIAYDAAGRGIPTLIGSADTFRAAAIEQLDVWAQRAGVEVVERERGADPASVCYEVIERGEAKGSQLVLIDTSGRLHTSSDLMRELEKVVKVSRKRSTAPVYVVLVIDATTGQNGLAQAREFNNFLGLDGVIITKLDGTAKGGIAVAISHELQLPIFRIGVGEQAEDLRPFDALEFSQELIAYERPE